MGASDWAGRMCITLEERFDIHSDRSVRLTTMVRLLRGEGAFGEHGSDQHEEHVRRLIDDLDESLAAQPGETVEEHWNNLMDDLGCQARTDEGVYLIPWDDHDAETWDEPGRTSTRPKESNSF